jgi:hypothetical protein
LSRSIRVAHALLRGASAFLSALARRPLPSRPLPSRDREGAVPPDARSPGVDSRCPVCQARFRGARICSRCGADLEPLMRLAVHAWQSRQAARQALDAGEVERALGFAIEAQGAQGTGSGEALRLLGAWLKNG